VVVFEQKISCSWASVKKYGLECCTKHCFQGCTISCCRKHLPYSDFSCCGKKLLGFYVNKWNY